MKLYWNTDVYGWRMWGFVGGGGKWFVGYSRKPTLREMAGS